MLKWTKRGLLGLVALTVVVLVSGIAFEQWSRWAASRDYKPVGKLIEVDGGKMHLNCSGKGAPTVVFESGLGESSASWSEIQPEIAKTIRACSYDRVGRLWSDGRQEPVTATGTATRLHSLLRKGSETPPYVMVGHSLGGPLIMVFADQYPEDVVGVVLVDAAHPALWERSPPEIRELNIVQGLDRALYAGKAAIGIMRLSQPDADDEISYEKLAELKNLPQTTPGWFAEMDAVDQIFAEAGKTKVFGDLPLIVLTAGRQPRVLPPTITPEIWSQFEKTISELQVELAALSTRGEQRIIADAGHYIHYGRPDVVIRAIGDMITAAQEPARHE
jgi:pimeloyl-ACP methyl ester carboxylesterase